MEKFTVDLDKVLDDFELQEDQDDVVSRPNDISISTSTEQKNEDKMLLGSYSESPLKTLDMNESLTSISNTVINNQKSQNINNIQDHHEQELNEDMKTVSEPITEQIACSDNLVIQEEHSNQSEKASVASAIQENVTPLNEATDCCSEPNHEPLLEPEAVDLNPDIVNSQPTLLDQSLEETCLNQPLVSDIIQTNIFNPTGLTMLTEAELESYLLELEQEDFLSATHTNSNGHQASSTSELEIATPPATSSYEITAEDSGDPDAGLSLDLPEGIDIESDVPQPNLFDSNVTEEETDSSDSDLEESGSASNDDEDDDDVPNLLDDPSLTCHAVPQQSPSTVNEPSITISNTLEEQGASQDPAPATDLTEPSEDSNVNNVQQTNVNSIEDQSSCIASNEDSREPTNESSDFNLANSPSFDGLNSPTSSEDLQGAAALDLEPYSSLTEEERLLGILKPVWTPDEEAPVCMNCSQRFTVIRRRHHCRACGRVLCNTCCSCRAPLEYMEGKEARVCLSCLQVLKKVEAYKKWGKLDENADYNQGNEGATAPIASSPLSQLPPQISRVNPNNPAEYCSTIPPAVQVASAASLPIPTVMVPVGVLKKEGSTSAHTKPKSEPKQVIFSDGIRPGGDLTELDAWRVPVSENTAASHRVSSRRSKPTPPVTPVVVPSSIERKNRLNILSPELPPLLNGPESLDQLKSTLADANADPVVFAMQPSQSNEATTQHMLTVSVKLVHLDCCIRRTCWFFATNGMRWVAQDEIIVLLERDTEPGSDSPEQLPPVDILFHLFSIYEDAKFKHHVIVNLGHTVTSGNFLGSTEHGGFLFFRTTFQCVQQLKLPSPPYLVGVLLQRWEIPWAKVFPLRLLLRLGAEFRYYPSPLFSVRKRKPVFGEVGHTIINLLADMRNFSYSLPAVTGLVVHMEEHETSVLLPKARYHQVCKALAQSNDHVISLAASFSPQADAHLVCLQADDGSYQTQAINIHTRPRKVTGASFLVFNGALKSSSGLTGRSSIVEDGVMVQLLPDKLEALKQALIRMEDFSIQCGKVTNEQPEEIVTIKWIEQEPSVVNAGVVSPIDGKNLSGISSIRVMQPRDYKGEGQRLLRWTELFILQMDDRQLSSVKADENSDITRFAEGVAKATCSALAGKLAALEPNTVLGLRVSSFGDSAEYQAGANFKSLPTQCCEELDSSLIPILHRESSGSTMPCILELWFQIFHP